MNINDIFNHLQDYWKEISFSLALVVLFWKKLEEFVKGVKQSAIINMIKDCFTSRSKTKKWRNDYINKRLEPFRNYTAKDEMRLYVPTRFQEERPNMYDIQEKGENDTEPKELIPYFLEKIWIEDNPDRYYCVLAETGMGKTTFLVQLLKAYINKYDEKSLPFEIFILPLADNNVIDKINKLPDSSSERKSILLLDALDENNNAYDKKDENGKKISSYEDFRKELEQAVERFQFTVITCRSQFFTDERSELEKLKYGKQPYVAPDKSLPKYKKLYISPFSKDDIDKFIEKKFKHNRNSKKKAKEIIGKIKYLAARPLILSFIDDLIGSNIKNVRDAYEIIIDKWLLREVDYFREKEDSKRQKDLLYGFSCKLAVYIYENWRKTGVLYLTQNEYEAFENKYEKENPDFNKLDFRYSTKSLITRDSQHNIIFTHKSFLEYFCAEQLFMGEISEFYFAEMNMAKSFFELFCQTKEDKLKEIGESDVDKARRYHNIGSVYYFRLEEYDKALVYFFKALAISKKVYGLDHPFTASTFNNIANLYWTKGDYDKALDIRRELAKTNRDAYIADLAGTLYNLAVLHDDLKRYDKAEKEYKEALEIYRELAEANRDAYIGVVAQTLNNLATLHRTLTHYDEAEKEYNEALKIRRELAKTNRDAYIGDVAESLNNLGYLNWKLTHYDEAEKEYNEALEIRRELADTNRDAYIGDVAQTLNNLGNLHSDLTRYDEAEKEYNEALEIRRELADTNRDAHIGDVALVLNNLGSLHKVLTRYDEAEKEYNEALEISYELTKSNRDAYIGVVAQTLNNLGFLHQDLARHEEAGQEYKEALKICREHANSNHDAYIADVALVLNNLAILHRNLTRYDEAEKECNEALEIRRELAKTNRDAYIGDVAQTLINLANLHKTLIHYDEAEEEYKEALKIYRELAETNRDAYIEYVAKTLNNLGVLHRALTRYDEAEKELKEALEIERELASTNRDAYIGYAAMTLANIARLQAATDRKAEAKKSAEEALGIYKELANKYSQIWNRYVKKTEQLLEYLSD